MNETLNCVRPHKLALTHYMHDDGFGNLIFSHFASALAAYKFLKEELH